MSSVAQTEKVIFQQEWGQVLAQSLRSSQQLLAELDLQVADFPEGLSEALQFPLFVPRPFVELEVIETDPGLKGDTAQGGSKPATLSTGAVVRVPLFIVEGEKLKIDTRTGEYVSRA